MSIDLTGYPYYDTTEEERKKGYVRLLNVAGRVVQGRELNVLQRLTHLQIKDIADLFFRDGAVVEGCQIGVQGTTVLVSSGKVYYQGYVIPIPETTLTITGSGIETIGVDIYESIVTENDDQDLRDPAYGLTNYGQPGMHRLKLSAQVVVKDEPTIKLGEIRNGVVYYDSSPPKEFYKIIELLAHRTFDESGNYVVEGLQVLPSAFEDETSKYVTLTKGRAYVEGYEVTIPTDTLIPLDKPKDTAQVNDEPFVYTSSTIKYYLRNQPVATVHIVEGIVEITAYITRGPVYGGMDDLRPYQPSTPIDQRLNSVVEIVSIAGYTKGTDWIQNGNYVDWSPNGAEPAPGSTYQCTWRYKKTMVPEERYPNRGDYQVLTDDNHQSYIQFINEPGRDLPVVNSTVEVTYDFYLFRHDYLYLNRNGEVKVVKGIPNLANLAKPTVLHDDRLLPLAVAILSPFPNQEIGIIDCATRRVTMEKLNRLIKRVENIEYNQAIDDLDREAMMNEQATSLRGILTEGFMGYTKVDLHHPLFEEHGCALDFETNSMTNLQVFQYATPEINPSATTARVHQGIITLPYTEVVSVSQPYATNYININQHNFFNAGAQIVLTPSVDNWVETVQVITGVKTENINVGIMRRWWSPHMAKDWYREQALRDRERLKQLGVDVDSIAPVGRSTQTYAARGGLILDKITEERIPYARANTIKIYGYNFIPYTDNLTLKCYNTIISCYPENQTYQGSAMGTLRADASGVVKGHFVLPGNTFPCGRLPITLYNSNNKAVAYYTAMGTRRVENYVIFNGTVTVTWTDPVAQSFGFTEDTVVTKIGLFFKSKDTTKPIIVEIRNVVNGYPGTIVYARKELFPSQVRVSDDASLETVVTFSEPVFCEKDKQYCIVLRTDSNLYHIWYAYLGNRDVKTKQVVTSNPYEVGVLFTSSNNETWTANQNADLKLKIYTARFASSAILEFKPIASTLSVTYSNNTTYTGFSRICLLSQMVNPEGTSIDWYYGYDAEGGTTVWKPIYPYDDIELPTLIDNVKLRAVLTSTNPLVTPFINKDTFVFAGFLTTEESYYVGRNVVTTTPFNKVKQILEVKAPSGCSFHVDYALDGTGTVWEHEGETRTPSSVENVGDGYYRYTFIDTLTDGETNFRPLVKITTNHPTNRVIVRRLMNILTYE
jgi:hypothetical protein